MSAGLDACPWPESIMSIVTRTACKMASEECKFSDVVVRSQRHKQKERVGQISIRDGICRDRTWKEAK